jgi:prepilin-type N-terminal cleavage/methylation domain-containing protein
MRVLASRKGFSLVELLTVIAIIAILASIIFPVMGLVGNKARMNKCMTQLHQVGLAIQMFKQDNRKYPDILGTEVMTKDGKPPAADGSNVVPMDQPAPSATPKAVGLFPEYVKAARLYHCPMSKFIDTKALISTVGAAVQRNDPLGDGVGIDAYPYNSYDFMIYGTDLRLHYSKAWAAAPDQVATVCPGAPGDPQRDYERQLKFRTPPDDTVITWCSWHEIWSVTGGNLRVSGKTPTLFLDGHADALDATDVESYRWRVLPKKE